MPIAALASLALLAGPYALQVNAHRWSPEDVAAAIAETGSEADAERVLTARALLLQEAKAFGFTSPAPTAAAQANAFLAYLYPEATICQRLGEQELIQAFQVMRKRFQHPPLVTLAELSWDCGAGEPHETLPCTQQAHALARRAWVPLVSDLHTLDDLAWLAASEPSAPLELRNTTWAVPALLNRLSEQVSEPGLPAEPTIGDAWVQLTPGGARLVLVVEAEPAANDDLRSPSVRDEVRAYACERRVGAARRQYVEGLLGSTRARRVPVPATQ